MDKKLEARLKSKGLIDSEIAVIKKICYATDISNLEYLPTKEDIARLEDKITGLDSKIEAIKTQLSDKIKGSKKQPNRIIDACKFYLPPLLLGMLIGTLIYLSWTI